MLSIPSNYLTNYNDNEKMLGWIGYTPYTLYSCKESDFGWFIWLIHFRYLKDLVFNYIISTEDDLAALLYKTIYPERVFELVVLKIVDKQG